MTRLHLIDWNTETLFGSEGNKSVQTVDAIIRGIRAGDTFPPVMVHQGATGVFYIDLSRELFIDRGLLSGKGPDGGHHRALGHYHTNQPLLVDIVGFEKPEIHGIIYSPIQQIELVDDSELPWRHRYVDRRDLFPNYR